MDVLKKLTLEIDGIVGTIDSYTSNPYISNSLNKLKESINNKDILEIKYFLNQLGEWYSDNQRQIQSNQYVLDKKTHIKIEKEIQEYLSELDSYSKVDEIKNSDKEHISATCC